MKKLLSTILAFVLLSCVVIPIHASATVQPHRLNGGPTFTVGTETPPDGATTVTVPITVTGNGLAANNTLAGFASVGFLVGFDADRLELTGINAPQPLLPVSLLHDIVLPNSTGTQQVSLTRAGGIAPITDWTGNGVIIELVFRILPDNPGFARVSISFPPGEPFLLPVTSGQGRYEDSTYLFANGGNEGGVYVTDDLGVQPPNTRRLTVHRHGGSGGLADDWITRDEWPIPLGEANRPTRIGYTFSHWSLEQDGPPVGGNAIAADAAGRPVDLHAVWTSGEGSGQPLPLPPALPDHRHVILNAGGGNWGTTAPIGWERHAPAAGNITEIRILNVRQGATMPNFPAPLNAPTGQMFSAWNPIRPGTMPTGTDPWSSTAVWVSGIGTETPPPPPVREGFRRIVLNAGGGHWGVAPPSDWQRFAPLDTSRNITAIWHDVEINTAMPTFQVPWFPPSQAQVFDSWSRERTEVMEDFGSNDEGDWASTAQWEQGSNHSPDTHPGLQRPPEGVTRPTGAGTITVLEHFGTWTGSGTSRARVDADHTTFQRLWYGNYIVSSAQLAVTSGSTVLTLSEAFLTPFANGTYTFLAEFTGGHASPINLIVSRGFGNVPQTGVSDVTVPLIAMGIALYLTLTAGVMLFFHVRQQKAKGKTIEKIQSN